MTFCQQLFYARPFKFQIELHSYVLGAAESHTGDASDTGEVQLLESLAGLLLVAVMDDGGRAGGKVSLASILGIGIIAAVLLVDGRPLGLVVRKLFDSGVRHFRFATEDNEELLAD